MARAYSLREAQEQLRTDNKTLARWMEQAGIVPRPDTSKQSRKLITRAQLEQLAALHGRTLPPDTPPTTPDPLADLETRLRAFIRREIATQLATLRTELLAQTQKPEPLPAEIPPVRAPEAPPARKKRKAFTADWRAKAWLFEEHGIPPRSMEGWRDIPLESREAVLAYAETQGELPRRRCDDATCPCQNAAL